MILFVEIISSLRKLLAIIESNIEISMVNRSAECNSGRDVGKHCRFRHHMLFRPLLP